MPFSFSALMMFICMDIVKRNLKSMGISWEEAGELAADRTEWRQRVAQCIYDAG